MSGNTAIQELEKMVDTLIRDNPEHFLVEVRIKPTNNIKVFIDGDQGISIEKLVQYNRRLYRQIEESNLFAGSDFSLEVSSPGLDEPLKLRRQYEKNIGRFVEVTGIEGDKKEGKLISANDDEIVIETIAGKGKKMETLQHSIPFNNIKSIKVQIKF